MNISSQLNRPLRSETHPEIRLLKIRDGLMVAETEAKRLYEEFHIGCDAYERAVELHERLEELFPDWLVPCETATKEWLDEQEERDAPVGRAR